MRPLKGMASQGKEQRPATYGHSHHAALRTTGRWQMPMQREVSSATHREDAVQDSCHSGPRLGVPAWLIDPWSACGVRRWLCIRENQQNRAVLTRRVRHDVVWQRMTHLLRLARRTTRRPCYAFRVAEAKTPGNRVSGPGALTVCRCLAAAALAILQVLPELLRVPSRARGSNSSARQNRQGEKRRNFMISLLLSSHRATHP
jgi:hypothetical protein